MVMSSSPHDPLLRATIAELADRMAERPLDPVLLRWDDPDDPAAGHGYRTYQCSGWLRGFAAGQAGRQHILIRQRRGGEEPTLGIPFEANLRVIPVAQLLSIDDAHTVTFTDTGLDFMAGWASPPCTPQRGSDV